LLLLQLFVDFSLPATPKSYRNEQLAHPRRSLRAQDVADLLRLLLLRRRHPIPAHRARPPRQAPQSSWHASHRQPGWEQLVQQRRLPWKMTIPRVSGLSMTTRSSSGVSPSAGPVRTTPKTMGERAVPRRSSPSSASPSLRRIPS
ncbi:unnamed protein product, partial [Musa hybrid cultivar]